MNTKSKMIIFEGDSWHIIREKILKQVHEAELDIKNEELEKIHSYMMQYGFFSVRDGVDKGLRFVGTFQVQIGNIQLQFYSFPKYMKKQQTNTLFSQMDTIRKVIEKTGHMYDYAEEFEFRPEWYNRKEKRIGRGQLAKWLVDDYAVNGIFYIKEKRHARKNIGSVQWNYTILRTLPIIQGDEAAYLTPIYAYTVKNDSVLLSEVHRCVIKEALSFLGDETERIYEPECREEWLGRLKQFVPIIKGYQRLVFKERDIQLLRCLEAWCAGESHYYEKPVGTVSFELVWEDVLRSIFGHKDLNGKVGFGAPKYHIAGNAYLLAGDSIPDGLNFWKDSDDKIRFLIIDGKYYLGEIENEKVRDLPGYKDIAKQIDYFETLTSVYGLETKKGKNAFLLPVWNLNEKVGKLEFKECNGLKIRYLGYAKKPEMSKEIKTILDSLNGDENTNKKNNDSNNKMNVHLLQVEAESMYKIYLESNTESCKYANFLWELCQESV